MLHDLPKLTMKLKFSVSNFETYGPILYARLNKKTQLQHTRRSIYTWRCMPLIYEFTYFRSFSLTYNVAAYVTCRRYSLFCLNVSL